MTKLLKTFDGWLSEDEDVAQSILKAVSAKADLKKQQSLYKFQDPNTIFEDMRDYVRMVIAGKQNGLMITGSPGVGKTYIVHDEIKKAGLRRDIDYYDVGSGSASPLGMYMVLYEQNGKLIIFDDCDEILDDKSGEDILKGALDSNEPRPIAWTSSITKKTASGEIIPKKFDFTGKVIFISNKAQRSLPPVLQTRSYVLEVALSPKDMLSYIKKMLPVIYPQLSMTLKKAALHVVQMIEKKNPGNVVLNMRTLKKAADILDTANDLDTALRQVTQQVSYDTK